VCGCRGVRLSSVEERSGQWHRPLDRRGRAACHADPRLRRGRVRLSRFELARASRLRWPARLARPCQLRAGVTGRLDVLARTPRPSSTAASSSRERSVHRWRFSSKGGARQSGSRSRSVREKTPAADGPPRLMPRRFTNVRKTAVPTNVSKTPACANWCQLAWASARFSERLHECTRSLEMASMIGA
jgi:hypothetical protein